jgi:hypothetical protein
MSLYDVNWGIQVQKLLPPVVREADFQEFDDDFLAGDPENQVIEYLILSSPGHWKEFPPIGVGIWYYLQGAATIGEIQRAIRKQLVNDIFEAPLVDTKKFPIIVVNSIVVELA